MQSIEINIAFLNNRFIPSIISVAYCLLLTDRHDDDCNEQSLPFVAERRLSSVVVEEVVAGELNLLGPKILGRELKGWRWGYENIWVPVSERGILWHGMAWHAYLHAMPRMRGMA